MKLPRILRIGCVAGKTEVEQGKFVKFIPLAKDNFKETYESQNINPISPTLKFNLSIMQIKVLKPINWFSVVSSIKKINLSVYFQYLTST